MQTAGKMCIRDSFMSLYGDSNTVKGYAFVSLKDKTVVGTGLLDTAKSDARAINLSLIHI